MVFWSYEIAKCQVSGGRCGIERPRFFLLVNVGAADLLLQYPLIPAVSDVVSHGHRDVSSHGRPDVPLVLFVRQGSNPSFVCGILFGGSGCHGRNNHTHSPPLLLQRHHKAMSGLFTHTPDDLFGLDPRGERYDRIYLRLPRRSNQGHDDIRSRSTLRLSPTTNRPSRARCVWIAFPPKAGHTRLELFLSPLCATEAIMGLTDRQKNHRESKPMRACIVLFLAS